MIRLAQLDLDAPARFPDPAQALAAPNGLLAFGGDLSPTRLLAAYANGIFPWYSHGDPLLWWSPDPRCVFATDRVHVARRLRRKLRHSTWTLTMDHAFAQVMCECAAPREYESGTWITPDMRRAYTRLHELGYAHSLEVWKDDALIGGIYGVAIGRLFSAESMFSRADDASKAALLALCRALHDWGLPLLDAQVPNPHLLRLGGFELARAEYLRALRDLVAQPGPPSTKPGPSCAACLAKMRNRNMSSWCANWKPAAVAEAWRGERNSSRINARTGRGMTAAKIGCLDFETSCSALSRNFLCEFGASFRARRRCDSCHSPTMTRRRA